MGYGFWKGSRFLYPPLEPQYPSRDSQFANRIWSELASCTTTSTDTESRAGYNVALYSAGLSSTPDSKPRARADAPASLVRTRAFGGEMKRWAWLLLVPVLLSLAGAQVSSSLNSQSNTPQTTSSQ